MIMQDATIAVLAGALTALAAIWWASRNAKPETVRSSIADTSMSFLFEDGVLVDASDDAEALLESSGHVPDWTGVISLFITRFSIPESKLDIPSSDGIDQFGTRDPADDGVLEITKAGRQVRVDLGSTENTRGTDGQKLHIAIQELATLRSASEAAPFPIWQVKDDAVTWHNPAYDALFRQVYDRDPQSDIALFRVSDNPPDSGKTRRVPISFPDQRETVWYDVQRAETKKGDFYSAVDADAIVRAEAAQRIFVQTLAKTFAHLPIGLAIFDSNRELVLFNPAVIDLTGLGADFLSSRPNLLSFFDELRNRRLMPEPKNYKSWRQQIADLVAAAADGRYSETWTLDSGRTYRVNGRPHPDGAIAFLIEDISAEVSLTRRFRAELELGQSVLDQMESAVAVFSSNGVLTVSNVAYRNLWDVDPDASFADFTVIDCMRDWQAKTKASPVLGEIRDFVLEFGERSSWSAQIETENAEFLEVDAVPLPAGASMIRFEISAPSKRGSHGQESSNPIPVDP